MSLEEAVFGENKTLWEVLDAQNLTNISTELSRFSEQLVTLGRTVDNNQVFLNDRINVLDTKVDDTITSINTISTKVDNVVSALALLTIKVDNLVVDVEQDQSDITMRIISVEENAIRLSDRISITDDLASDALTVANQALSNTTLLTSEVNGLKNLVDAALLQSEEAFILANDANIRSNDNLAKINQLEANKYRFTLLRGGNEYYFGYKPTSTTWRARRITFNVSSNTIINSNVSYPCTILENGVVTNISVRVVAIHDSFATTGIVSYPMVLGSCLMIYAGATGNGNSGYMTIL